ncbi:hypothetical protein BaRGS_00029483, partial [Batillaria attramentaria]
LSVTMYAAALTRKTATCMCIFVVLAQSSTPSAGGNAKDAIRLEFVNELKDPHFDFFISLHTTTAKTIKELLEEAAWKDPTFNPTSSSPLTLRGIGGDGVGASVEQNGSR